MSTKQANRLIYEKSHTYCSMPSILLTGIPGVTKLLTGQGGKTSPFFFPSAIPPATGAMLWRESFEDREVAEVLNRVLSVLKLTGRTP